MFCANSIEICFHFITTARFTDGLLPLFYFKHDHLLSLTSPVAAFATNVLWPRVEVLCLIQFCHSRRSPPSVFNWLITNILTNADIGSRRSCAACFILEKSPSSNFIKMAFLFIIPLLYNFYMK